MTSIKQCFEYTPYEDLSSRRFAVILAGGSGTRLWPLSRSSKPKQLLTLNGDESLLQQTARRLLPLVDASHITTVAHRDYRFEISGQLHAVSPGLPNQVLVEPFGRNTLPAIAWSVSRIYLESPQALVGVFSSDHAITDIAAFQATWLEAEKAAELGNLVLIGITPDHAATGYGWIEIGSALKDGVGESMSARKVSRFIEKPAAAMAEAFLKGGRHVWNSGMFVFRADVFMDLLAHHQPVIHSRVVELSKIGSPEANPDLYQTMDNVSIDYGLLELTDRLAVVSAAIGWNDLGSWEAIYQVNERDAAGNSCHGDVVAMQSENNLMWSEHGFIAALGVNDLAVVQTRDATLIAHRSKVQEIKNLVEQIKGMRAELTEVHATVMRPWGSYTVLEEGPQFKVKRIVVNPGAQLSMQMHHHRSEHWVVIHGTAKITVGEEERFLSANESSYIAKTQRHRLENPGKIPVEIIEIQSGSYLGEDDIVRFDDVYGRT